jgi:hypothetical protein
MIRDGFLRQVGSWIYEVSATDQLNKKEVSVYG